MSKRFLSQCLPVKDSARNRAVKAAALEKAKGWPKRFSRHVRGLECPCCGSTRTITEFYRIPPGKAQFGVTACDECGAC